MNSKYKQIGALFLSSVIVILLLSFRVYANISKNGQLHKGNTSAASEKQKKKNRFVMFPAAFYTPSTGISGVFSCIYLNYGNEKNQQSDPDMVSLATLYSVKNQLFLLGGYQDYLCKENLLWKINGIFIRFPKKYYGMGPTTEKKDEEEFTDRRYSIKTTLQYRFFKNIFFGPAYHFSLYRAEDLNKDKPLYMSEIEGIEKSSAMGLGLAADFDTRNNKFSATKGVLVKTAVLFYRFASDFEFQTMLFDLRSYHSITQNNIVALEFLTKGVRGHPPFQEYPQLGGENIMRGYHRGRYRDRIYSAAQVEHRFFFNRRWSTAAFISAGDVAPSMGRFSASNIKFAGGVGIRFYIAQKQRICYRLDLGFTKMDKSVYINMFEAF